MEIENLRASPDRPFDPAKVPATVRTRQLVAEVLARLAAAEERVRRRRAVDQRIHNEAVAALVCDLVHRAIGDPEGWLTVELSNAALAPQTRRAPFMTEQFRQLIRAMASPKVEAIKLQLGQWATFNGLRSTIQATAWLLQRAEDLDISFTDIGRSCDLLGDPLLLRSNKIAGAAEALPVPETELARRLRAEMIEINSWLASANLARDGCEVTDGVDLGRRYLRRVFNDGSLERGGRLFHGFWLDLRKADRLESILIDGSPIASLDFAQLSVRLAYAQVGRSPPEGDLYQVLGVGTSREGVKKVMNALLASEKVPTKLPQGTRQHFPRWVKMADVVTAISTRHPALVPLFGTAQALTHQNIESRIVIRALLRLKRLGVVGLPVHDCVLVKDSDAEVAKSVLEESFEEETGLVGMVEVERSPRALLRKPIVHLGSPIGGGVSA